MQRNAPAETAVNDIHPPNAATGPQPGPSTTALAPNALIVGCGFLGLFLAEKLLERGAHVYGTTRQPTRARQLASLGIKPLFLSVTEMLTTAVLRPLNELDQLDVYYMVPPGRVDGDPPAHQVLIDGLANVMASLKAASVRRALYISSTAVYGATDGRTVNADSTPDPQNTRGQHLLEAENLWARRDWNPHILRLAGLYGPGRIVGQRALMQGAPIIGDPESYLNLIHVHDAVQLILALMAAPQPAPVELGCDDTPVARRTYYNELAQRLHLPPPNVLDNHDAARMFNLNPDRLRRAGSKKCDNTPTRQRTGWSPQYPSFRHGLDDLLNPQPPNP